VLMQAEGDYKTMNKSLYKIVSLALLLTLVLPQFCVADKICLKIANSKISRKTVASNKKCAKGFTEIVDTAKFTGPAGATGPTGAAGLNGSSTSDFVWGTGADGDLTLSGTTTIDPLKQYNNITVDSSAIVTVPAGSSIRCKGTLTVGGQLVSAAGGAGGKREVGFDGSSLDPSGRSPSSSLNFSPASTGEIIINLANSSVGEGGVNQSPSSDIDSLKNTFKVGVIAGGGGAGSLAGEGGSGGGSLALLCKQGIIVLAAGVVNVDGAAGNAGAGGGSGGLAILATNGTILNQGTIRARGGAGGALSNTSGAGGGGGGGIINLVASSIQITGGLLVTGGTGAVAGGPISGVYRSGGGAGGSLGGVGGNGGSVSNTSNTSTAGANGANGQAFQTTVIGADVAAILL